MIGKTISHYKILEKLGEGGMGVVYRAEDTKLKRTVALKFLPPELTRDKEAKDRFIHEARAAACLDHNNICAVHEIDETKDGQMYIAMAFYEGETLKERIEKGPLKISEAIDIAIQVAEGLERAHESKIIHRDIKSANIFITSRNEVKIIDFGLAKLKGQTKLTKEGTTLGTVAYMSPEQTMGPDVDHRTDIWALGVIMYEMLTGECPFKGDYPQAVIYSIMNEEPEPLRKINAAVPTELEAVVHQALTKEPADRYQTSKELLEDLEAVSQGLKPLKAGPVRSIRMAVLPFANLTGDIEQEYLSDGFTQEMISQLGRLHPENLSVIARSSVMRYKNGNTPIDQIGRELKVDYVLEGSTRRDLENIRISADLIQVKDQTQLWGDTYEREFSDILKLQSEVAKNVAEALALKLLPAEQTRANTIKMVNPEAYDAYLKGSYHWQKLTPTDLDLAQKYFDLARAKDPLYAPAYEGLAITWVCRQQMFLSPPHIAGPKGKEAALRAIELDDTSAGSHEALALLMTWTDWDWEEAGTEWQRALELNPNAASTHAYYAHYLAITGRVDDALPHAERACELDPFNSLFKGLYALIPMYQQKIDEALEVTLAALEMQPDQWVALINLYMLLYKLGRYDELLSPLRKIITHDPERLAILEEGFVEGEFKGAMKRLAEYGAAHFGTPKGEMPTDTAGWYMMIGDYDRAVDFLEKAYEIREPNMPYLGHCFWDELRGEQRFQDLLRKMKLPLRK